MKAIFKPLVLVTLLMGLFLNIVGHRAGVLAQEATCPEGNGWVKIDSNDLSSYPVAGATEYCFKAGSSTSVGCNGGLFNSWPQPEGTCGLSHWSYLGGAIASPSPEPSVSPSPSVDPSPSVSPSPSVIMSPGPSPSASPDPSPGIGGPEPRNGTSLSNDHLQCTETQFDAVFDVFDHGNPVNDLKVTFTFNGSTKEVKTNVDGRAKVQFPIEAGTVMAKADGYSSQSMTITEPVGCPDVHLDPNKQTGQVLGTSTGGRGQVLGASTMADTGNSSTYLALILISLGVVITSVAGYGIYQENSY